MSLRLPDDLAGEISVVARAEAVSVSEVIRAALYQYLSSVRTDPEFQQRLRERLEEDREILERLSG